MKQPAAETTALWICDTGVHAPFSAPRLPFMAKLTKRALTPYRTKLAKRLFKRPVRMAFDIAFDVLKVDNPVSIKVQFPDNERILDTTLQSLHHFNAWGFDGSVYEPDVAALLSIFLKGDVRFADIGANWGYFSVYAATLPAFSGPIDAVEPMPWTHADLESAIQNLILRNRVTTHHIALSSEAGSVSMATEDAKHSGIARVVDDATSDATVVPCFALDDSPIAAPDVIKMDVEEHELHVLKGAVRVLNETKPFIIMENWHNHGDPEQSLAPLRFLKEHGYALFRPVWYSETTGPSGAGFSLREKPPTILGRTLALAPLDWLCRSLLPDQITVFALHRSRVGELSSFGFRPVTACP